MTAKDKIKLVAAVVVSIGTGALVGAALRPYTSGNKSFIVDVCAKIGLIAVEGLVASAAVSYMNETVEEAFSTIEKFQNAYRATK